MIDRIRTVFSIDLLLGLAVAVLAGWAALSDEVAQTAQILALATAGLSLTALAVVLTIMALLVVFISDEFVMVLESAGLTMTQVLRPYRSVVVATAIATVTSLATAVVAPLFHAGGLGPALLLGASVGTTVWGVVGTIQLIGITAIYAEHRASLLTTILRARQTIRQRRAG